MKKIILGPVIAGLIIFVCQTISWTIIDLHRPANQYSPKQTEILHYLDSQLVINGQYMLPTVPAGTSMDEASKMMKTGVGKPWALIAFHKEMKNDMASAISRALIVDIIMMGLFCWILAKIPDPRFSTIWLSSVMVGLIVFLNIPYTTHIFYETFDLWASLIDAVAGWGLAGLWLAKRYAK
ncbi:MAG: hypothetical protein ABI687_12065 [Flavitalea sp.]